MEMGAKELKEDGKTPRKRMKAIHTKIREKMEFYFSDANLHKDRFLKKAIDQSQDGYIDLSTFLSFNQMTTITDNVNTIVDALINTSTMLQVSEDKTKVKRQTPISVPKNIDERTVYVECLPHNIDHEWVKKVFSSCGKVSYISLPKYQSTGDLKGFAFVEFETEKAAAKACEELNNPPAGASNKPGMFPKTSKTMEALKKQLPPNQTIDEDEDDEVHKNDSNSQDIKEEDLIKPSTSKRGRRRCALSESSIEGGNSVTESPSKRKKSEVSFEVPEGSRSEDNEKQTPGSGKKKSKKRKQRMKTTDGETTANSEDTSLAVKSKSEEVSSENVIKDSPNAKKRKIEIAKQGDSSDNNTSQKGSAKKRVLDSPGSVPKYKSSEISSDTSATESPSTKKRKVDSEKAEDSVVVKKDSPKKKGGSQVKGETSTEQKVDTKKGQGRRKRKKQNKAELPELRVLPKTEWAVLKKEYLKMQKESMAKLKQALNKNKQAQNEAKAQAGNSKKKAKEIEYVPDVIVKVVSESPLMRKQLKSEIPDSVSMAYMDFKDGLYEGHIRCESSSSARSLMEQELASYKFTCLAGDDEKAYWDKLKSDRESKYKRTSKDKDKDKTRGQQKLIDRAQTVSIKNMKVNKKHIVFEDSD